MELRFGIGLGMVWDKKSLYWNCVKMGIFPILSSFLDEKPRKTKKRKQPKTSPEPGNPKKTKAIKPDKKIKRGSLTDSEKSSKNSQTIIKKKVKKTKRVLASSDEEESGKEMATDGVFLENIFHIYHNNIDGVKRASCMFNVMR